MALFAKRPLAAGFAATIFAVIFSELFSFPLILAFLILGVLLLAFFFVLAFTHRRKPAALFLLLIALGLLAGSLRVLHIHQRERALRDAIGKEALVVAEVEEILVSGSYGSELLVSVKRLDGRTVSGNAILKTEETAPFIVGDKVTAACTVKALDADAYVENRHLYYRAQGAAVQLSLTGEIKNVVPAGEQSKLSFYLERIHARAVGRVRTHIDGDAGDLAVAMLIGERTSLSGSVANDFRHAGVSHLLALSGLHLGILTLLVERLLLGVGFSRRWRIFLIFLLVFGYLLLAGLPTSLLRAALMLFMMQLAFLLRTRADTLTSLFFAAAVLLLLTPTAMFSPSMQMTLLATFGILSIGKLARVLFGRRYREQGIGNKLLFWVPSSLLLTLSAS
ncbi:MAG: ComEC/Rec2 family competence protein, partial [Clostridia bacterium]|nr:ComEC/Rec2 family competence protein [Clostridia bacterium]